MKKFNMIFESIMNDMIKPFEDYSNKIVPVNSKTIKGKLYKYVDCNNHCLISEDSLSRTLKFMDAKDYAIISAYRGHFSKIENIQRNRILRGKLNMLGMGVHQLVGHWQEAPEGKEYHECTPDLLTDVVERSYLIVRPDDMPFEDFKNLIMDLMTIDGETQDAAVIKNEEGVFLLYNNGSIERISGTYSLGDIEQAYSQHVSKPIPFAFNGKEIPDSNITRQIYSENKILY